MTDDHKSKGVSDASQIGFKPDAAKPAKGLTLKVRRVGNSLGVVLPKEVLAKLRIGEGAELTVSDTPDGVALSTKDSETAELIRLAEGIMAKRRKVLKA